MAEMMSSNDLYTGIDYAAANPTWHDEDGGVKAANIAKIVHANNISCQKIVDTGCGTGSVLDALLRHDIFRDSTAIGYDIAPYAINLAKHREKNNLKFHCGDFFQTGENCDLLLCIDVFEHVDDYIGFLRRLRGRSRYYTFHIPLDMNVVGLIRGQHLKQRKEVGHLHYFDQATALATLRDTDFKIIDAQYTRTAEDILQIHPEWRTTTAILGNAARGIVRTMAGEDLSVRLLGGASLIVLTS
ncbi:MULTISPECIES: class I SAM-dependent methyltransferase [unclassified Mesorhizobium]|uniref:class I SAM-dependent methyltransferase n=1 Tax=unclassified Mesorhizobium TaxID=325217 RepID=UPI00333E15A3